MIIIKINMVMIFTSIWAKNYAEGRIKMIGKDEPLMGIGYADYHNGDYNDHAYH